LISGLYGHMYAIRSTKSVPEAHLIGGESQSASQSLSTRTKCGDEQYIRDLRQLRRGYRMWVICGSPDWFFNEATSTLRSFGMYC